MNQRTRNDSNTERWTAATFLPPAIVEETAWDILLTLHTDSRSELSLEKLARVVSITKPALNGWLAVLEQKELVTGATNEVTGEVRAILTAKARQLLDSYLAATRDLQLRAQP